MGAWRRCENCGSITEVAYLDQSRTPDRCPACGRETLLPAEESPTRHAILAEAPPGRESLLVLLN